MDEKLVIQAAKEAYLFLHVAERLLEARRGDGYVAAHPEIVAAYMLTAALNFHAQNRDTSEHKNDTTK